MEEVPLRSGPQWFPLVGDEARVARRYFVIRDVGPQGAGWGLRRRMKRGKCRDSRGKTKKSKL